ncbi:MAG: ArnT family glycosyltransferase [Candidatus Eiseniibacteriota bacterium]
MARRSSRPGSANPPPAAPGAASARYRWALLGLTAIAALLRLTDLTHAPPGLNQDEAIGSWISWCLLKTGHDMTGQAWPIFYSHGIGDYPSTLFLYLTIPFQWLGGLNVWTARLPSAASGVLCVPLLAYVGTRLFDRRVGLAAAILLTLNPWHLFLSRFGIGASHCSMFALLAVALMLAARLPLADHGAEPPRIAPALLAGLAAGIACYGYPPLRIYFPALFVLLALAQWRSLRASLGTRAGRLAFAALALAFLALFVPLAIEHVVDPHIAHRWEMTRLWDAGASPLEIESLVAARYAAHFSPDFLFIRGDRFVVVNPLHTGAFPWVALPLLILGAAFALARWRSSAAARTLAVLVLAYPAGDLVSRYDGVHSQRSAAGVGALVLVAAYGAIALWEGLRVRAARQQLAAGLAASLVVIAAHAIMLTRYFREFDRSAEIYHAYDVDLARATHWLKPRFANYDAVFWTTLGMNQPFASTLVGLGYDPRRWFAEPREVRTHGEWEVTERFGKIWFMYDAAWREEARRLASDGRPDRVLFIVRPGELDLPAPIETIRGPDGTPALLLCERTL